MYPKGQKQSRPAGESAASCKSLHFVNDAGAILAWVVGTSVDVCKHAKQRHQVTVAFSGTAARQTVAAVCTMSHEGHKHHAYAPGRSRAQLVPTANTLCRIVCNLQTVELGGGRLSSRQRLTPTAAANVLSHAMFINNMCAQTTKEDRLAVSLQRHRH